MTRVRVIYLYTQSLVHVTGESLVPQELIIPIRLGDTIPGYVAAKKEIMNVNLIKQVCPVT